MNVQEAEEVLRLMKIRHERELFEAHTMLNEAQHQAYRVLEPWVKNDNTLSELRAWLKGPKRRVAAKVYGVTRGYRCLFCMKEYDMQELNFQGVDLEFVIKAVTAIFRGEGWTVCD